MEASQLKWVNPVFNIVGVSSLRLGGLQICFILKYDIMEVSIYDIVTSKEEWINSRNFRGVLMIE